MAQLGNEGDFSYDPVPVGSKSGCANPIADEIARAAFITAAASAGTWAGLILVTGPETLTAATTSRFAPKTGALTQRAPRVVSTSSTAYPCFRIIPSSCRNCTRFMMVFGVRG